MARWIIPDIHGCARTLEALLKNMLKVTRDDELFFLGDYIDRGPASKEALDLLMDLQEGGWNIHCLKGNHEDYCVRTWEADQQRHLFKPDVQKLWENVGAKETYKSFGVKRPREIPEKYIEWMRNLLYYYEMTSPRQEASASSTAICLRTTASSTMSSNIPRATTSSPWTTGCSTSTRPAWVICWHSTPTPTS